MAKKKTTDQNDPILYIRKSDFHEFGRYNFLQGVASGRQQVIIEEADKDIARMSRSEKRLEEVQRDTRRVQTT